MHCATDVVCLISLKLCVKLGVKHIGHGEIRSIVG